MEKEQSIIADKMVIAEIAKGHEESFRTLVHELYKKLFSFTASLVKSEAEADDIMQDVFLKIWLHRSSLPSLDNPFGWIYTILVNTISNHLRSKIRRELNLNRLNFETTTIHLEDELDAKFTESLIDKAASLLPEKRKLVFLLNKKEGLNRKEIAERLHISENTVRNQLSEAIHFIREKLQRTGNLNIPVIFLLAYIVKENFLTL